MINGSVAKQMVPRPESGSNVVALVENLMAGYRYQFSVKSIVLDVASAEVLVNATTSEFISLISLQTCQKTSVKVISRMSKSTWVYESLATSMKMKAL